VELCGRDGSGLWGRRAAGGRRRGVEGASEAGEADLFPPDEGAGERKQRDGAGSFLPGESHAEAWGGGRDFPHDKVAGTDGRRGGRLLFLFLFFFSFFWCFRVPGGRDGFVVASAASLRLLRMASGVGGGDAGGRSSFLGVLFRTTRRKQKNSGGRGGGGEEQERRRKGPACPSGKETPIVCAVLVRFPPCGTGWTFDVVPGGPSSTALFPGRHHRWPSRSVPLFRPSMHRFYLLSLSTLGDDAARIFESPLSECDTVVADGGK